MSANIKLSNQLQAAPRYVGDDNEIIFTIVPARVPKINRRLSRLRYSDEKISVIFLDKIEGHGSFHRDTFIDYISQKIFLDIPSYRFYNCSDLTIGDNFLHCRGKVTLDWYCIEYVLEEGQEKKTEKCNAIFCNNFSKISEDNYVVSSPAAGKL